jgi:DNA-binding transcriptional MerR regulator
MQEEKTYRIGELAAMTGLTARTLRYYEELGLLKASGRDEGVHRRYPEQNLIYLKRVAQLKSYGLSLLEIKDFFRLANEDRTGESCKRLLIAKYNERLEKAQETRREAERQIRELKWHVRQLEEVENFFECPGRQCTNCNYIDDCDMRL